MQCIKNKKCIMGIPFIITRCVLMWIILIVIILGIMSERQGLTGTYIYRFGPNAELYILGFCIDTNEKYACIVAFCFLNSGVRTLNVNILRPWITNQVQDTTKPLEVSQASAYEISCVSCLYTWYDFFMYMNILFTQIDMMLIEIAADLMMTIVLTAYYTKREVKTLEC